MHRIPLLLVAMSLLPACATEVATTDSSQQATHYVADGVRCDPSFCILFTAQDSDHDGVADVDELAAGTDPNDPLNYPTLIDLATLMAAHQLATFEIGNSMMVLLPTRDANGLPVFGGDALTASRKSSLETAGIKAPAGIDLSRGFTMSRTAVSNEMSFGQLFTAFGGEPKGTMPVRLLADAIGWTSPSGNVTTTEAPATTFGADGVGGTLQGESKWGDDVSGTWSYSPEGMSYQVSSRNGDFHEQYRLEKNADGSTAATTTTTFLTATTKGATTSASQDDGHYLRRRALRHQDHHGHQDRPEPRPARPPGCGVQQDGVVGQRRDPHRGRG